jgi:hypothetical protein
MDNVGYVFDMDGTLIYSDQKVGVPVIKNGQVIKTLLGNEYSSYVKQEGETFDYSKANDPTTFLKISHCTPIFFEIFCNIDRLIQGTDSKIYILTARQKNMEDVIYEFFRSFNLKSLTRKDVICCVQGFAPELKKNELKKLCEIHDKILFYDDCDKNISYANTLEKVLAHKVKCQIL